MQVNFGGNVRFKPAVLLTPPDRNAVLDCLERCRGREIRAIGSGHSWSGAASGADVLLDLRRIDSIALRVEEGSAYADIEAGCTVDAALDYLHANGGYTLPTYGIIGKQTIAGAISTGTHGSGRASLSNYVSAVSVAGYDEATGKARIFTFDGGDELRAARCAVGSMGIVLSVRMRVEPEFLIQEQTALYEGIDEILEREPLYTRTQFYLIPWSWKWFAQLRRPLVNDSGAVVSCSAKIRRIVQPVLIDFALHGAIRFFAVARWWSAIRWLYTRTFATITNVSVPVTDDARRIVMMHHDLWRHVEMELFVPARHVIHAAAFVEWALRTCGDQESHPLPAILERDAFGGEPLAALAPLKGRYVHDYLITFRRVLRDDALISMTSGEDHEVWYAISLITYQRDLGPFKQMARVVAAAMASAYGARPHWGKICPLDADEIASLYPALPRFREICALFDPEHNFVNDFGRLTLGFAARGVSSPSQAPIV